VPSKAHARASVLVAVATRLSVRFITSKPHWPFPGRNYDNVNLALSDVFSTHYLCFVFGFTIIAGNFVDFGAHACPGK